MTNVWNYDSMNTNRMYILELFL